MNKNDLIKSIAQSAQISRVTAEMGLNGLLSALEAAMKEGQRVTLVGFGSFSVVDRAPRTGRNPITGAVVKIKATSVPKFRPGSEFKSLVSGAKKTTAKKAAAPAAEAPADETV